MKTVVVTSNPRADLKTIDRFAKLGVATTHEASGRTPNLMKTYIKSYEDIHSSGLAWCMHSWERCNSLSAARRQLDDPCCGGAVPSRRCARCCLYDGQHRRHVRRAAGDFAEGARCARPGD